MIEQILVNQVPIVKARPRFVRRGKFAGVYNAQETEEGRFILEAKGQISRKLKGAVKVWISLVFPRPKSHFRTGKNAGILRDDAPIYCKNPKDVDNAAKFYLDCLNGIAWEDDCQVIKLDVWKRWATTGESAHIHMSIAGVEEE